MLRNRCGWVAGPLLSLVLCGSAASQEAAPEGAAQGQDTPAPAETVQAAAVETRVFVLQHVDARELAPVLRAFPASISHSNRPPLDRALAVSASPAVLAAIEQTIERLDKPTPSAQTVELTVHIVEALADASTSDVPPSVEPVVAQLRETFRYQGYRIVDSLLTTTSGDSPVTITGAAHLAALVAASYELNIQRINVTAQADGTSSVGVKALTFALQEPGPPTRVKASVRASVEIGDGQQVVVGKSGLGDSGNALILVLSAKIAD